MTLLGPAVSAPLPTRQPWLGGCQQSLLTPWGGHRSPGAVSSSPGSPSKGHQLASHAVSSLGKGFCVVQRSLGVLWPPPPSWPMRLRA